MLETKVIETTVYVVSQAETKRKTSSDFCCSAVPTSDPCTLSSSLSCAASNSCSAARFSSYHIHRKSAHVSANN